MPVKRHHNCSLLSPSMRLDKRLHASRFRTLVAMRHADTGERAIVLKTMVVVCKLPIFSDPRLVKRFYFACAGSTVAAT